MSKSIVVLLCICILTVLLISGCSLSKGEDSYTKAPAFTIPTLTDAQTSSDEPTDFPGTSDIPDSTANTSATAYINTTDKASEGTTRSPQTTAPVSSSDTSVPVQTTRESTTAPIQTTHENTTAPVQTTGSPAETQINPDALYSISAQGMTLKYPYKWKDKISVLSDDEGIYFLSGGVKLFDILFGGTEGSAVGNVKIGDEIRNLRLYMYTVSDKLSNRGELTEIQNVAYIILNYIASDYEFDNTDIPGETDYSVYEIQTRYIKIYYPAKWKNKVSVSSDNGGVYFSRGGIKLFDIFFGGTEGDLLGTLKLPAGNVVLRIFSYALNKNDSNYAELSAMQSDAFIILNRISKDYDFAAGEDITQEDNTVFEIQTNNIKMYYPAKWKNLVTVTTDNNGVYFSSGGIKLFDIMFGGTDGSLLGTVRLASGNIVLRIVSYNIGKDTDGYAQLSAMQNDVNVILSHIGSDYDFVIGEEIIQQDNTVFEIQTSNIKMYYPAKWKNLVTVTTDNNGVYFSSGGTKLFDIMFGGTGGSLLGTVKLASGNIVLRIVSYNIGKDTEGYAQLSAMQNDVNVILSHIGSDYDFAIGEEISQEDSSVFEIQTNLIKLYYPAKWKNLVTVTTDNNGVYFSRGGIKLFDILFGGTGGSLLGTVKLASGNIVLRIVSYSISKDADDYDRLSAMLNDVNVILSHISSDYDFTAGEDIGQDDNSVFGIQTNFVKLYYPSKWKNTVTVSADENGVYFSCGGVKLFDIMFGGTEGYVLGTVKLASGNVVLKIISPAINKTENNYTALVGMQNDVNVIINYLIADYDFVLGQEIT